MGMEELRRLVLERIDIHEEGIQDRLMDIIEDVITEQSKKEYIPLRERNYLVKEIHHSICELDVLQELLDNEEITEIMINGPNHIFIEEKGRLYESGKTFTDMSRLENVIQQIVGRVNRRVNETSPIADARLADGSRVNIVLPPAALNGPVLTIRKFPKESMTIEQLIALGSVSEAVAKDIRSWVQAGYNIFVSGGTGSGKTTFLNAMSQFIPSCERVITIEDSAELQLSKLPNLVRLETRDANVEGEHAITIHQLLRSSLRMRPDRIIVGEVRGAEALDMLQAMNTGHDGSLSTGHANSPEDMVSRLETMILTGIEMPLAAIRSQIASGLDIIIHLGRLRDKSRKVLQIKEVMGMDHGEVRLQTLYEFEERRGSKDVVEGDWVRKAELTNRNKLFLAGLAEQSEAGGEKD